MGINDMKFVFMALASTGSGISGGDRIFIELARSWSKKSRVEIFTTTEGEQMCERQKLLGQFLQIKIIGGKLPRSFLGRYIYKVILGIKFGFTYRTGNQQNIYIYSSSDFWMDVLPAVLLKMRFPKSKWIATWYQTAPNPFSGFAEGSRNSRYRLNAIPYWFSQFCIRPFIAGFADKIIVNNESEKKRFPEQTKKGKTVVLIGAVSLSNIENWRMRNKRVKKVYDAVFQGRFHPQKGVVELVDIWKSVVKKRFDAKLAMIGDGPLRKEVELRIKKYNLGRNIRLFGYIFDGPEKYKIFSQSKIVVHPAFYDSGGMASAEAMAFGLPAVGFNLEAYKSYYPEGMLKVEKGNIKKFSDAILNLLEDDNRRNRLGKETLVMINKNWSWEKRAEEIFGKITERRLNG